MSKTWASFAAVFLVLLSRPDATCGADSPNWLAAQELSKQIRVATPKLSERERKAFLTTFAELRTRYDSLEADEQILTKRLLADQRDLRQHVEAEAAYNKDRAEWEARLSAHNRDCKRRFTNPQDVARCDEAGNTLAKEKVVLDAREERLAQRAKELKARQTENSTLVTALETSSAAWSKRVDADFSVPLRKALGRTVGTTTLRLTVKSFISVVDLTSMSVESRPRAERMFAWFTNGNFSEHPSTPAPDTKDFRLWSQAVVVASCRGDTIASWKSSLLAHRSGKELRILDAETSVMDPLVVMPASRGTDDVESIGLSYAIKGKPNDLALSSFRFVSPRTCDTIWHRVRATVTCHDGTAQMATVLEGSRFPSHRTWANAEEMATVPQGPFVSLWDCDPSAPDRVR